MEGRIEPEERASSAQRIDKVIGQVLCVRQRAELLGGLASSAQHHLKIAWTRECGQSGGFRH